MSLIAHYLQCLFKIHLRNAIISHEEAIYMDISVPPDPLTFLQGGAAAPPAP